MPAAAAVKGIILSLSIITALGIAVIENPQIQAWLEEQRRRIAELLRHIGEDLDPASRRAAEAFALQGRTIVNDEGLQREESGSRDAAEVATGWSLSNVSTVRRIPVRGPTDAGEAEERERKGREYLARRHRELHELQQRRKAKAKAEGAETPPSPTFDELVDAQGNLKTPPNHPVAEMKELPSPPAGDLLPQAVASEMRQVELHLSQPVLMAESSSSGSTDWQMESVRANPFSNEHAVERSITPKPPVPPKIELDRPPTPPIVVPGSFKPTSTEPRAEQGPSSHEGLSYEEQLAIALSLSEQESSAHSAAIRQNQDVEGDNDLRAAIAASLKEMDNQQAAQAAAREGPATPKAAPIDTQLLVDLTPAEPSAIRPPQGNWAALWDTQFSPSQESVTPAPPSLAPSEASDELYRLTPELTRARLATLNALQDSPRAVPPSQSPNGPSLPFDPVRDAIRVQPQQTPDVMDASFHSALDDSSPQPSNATLERETPRLIDVEEESRQEGARTPTSRAPSSFGFQTDSDTDTFASVSPPALCSPSRPRSEISNIEVIELAEDSDVDMLSEEGDGVATPDSWSEVGSRDADSEMEDNYQHQSSRLSL